MHGDAAFAGQGVVAETLNLSQLRGYRTGGTVHVVINNQVGFTTAPEYSRSSLYSTDVARMIQAPIFHVNGDDPEAVLRVARLAFEYRQAFNKDVVVDVLSYRRRGHNEGDDPSMTNPKMYQIIDGKRSVRKIYTEELIGRGDITLEQAEELLRDYQVQLEQVFKATRDANGRAGLAPTRARIEEPEPLVDTAIDPSFLAEIGEAHVRLPDGFTPHKRVAQLLERRAKMAVEGKIDWGFAEIIAFGSLVRQGLTVRLSGQDSRRGTFVQRHASIVDSVTGEDYLPVKSLEVHGGRFFAHDSLLSEFAVMGFEYGYSVENPEALVCWEAQFGDFANGAQSIVDEFISSGEVKWGQRSSVTLLLPHSHEGQGPDHTSGRIERYLQLCAEDNMRVAVPTTPASYFHLLRRQALSPKKKPLVVFTPKSLLRHRQVISSVADFTSGTFEPVLGDPGPLEPAAVKRVVFCSGKVFYDLLAGRAERGLTDTAIVRLEQLYPLPVAEIKAQLARYPNVDDVAWVQEEPANQGAWTFIAMNLLPRTARGGRPAGVAPASRCASGRLDQAARRGAGQAHRGRVHPPVTPAHWHPDRRPAPVALASREEIYVLHRPWARGADPTPRQRDGVDRVVGGTPSRVRRRQPRVRDSDGALRDLARPPRRRRRRGLGRRLGRVAVPDDRQAGSGSGGGAVSTSCLRRCRVRRIPLRLTSGRIVVPLPVKMRPRTYAGRFRRSSQNSVTSVPPATGANR